MNSVGTNPDTIAIKRALLTVRCCSKWLAAASDATVSSITLHPSTVNNAVPHLSKLASLTAATIQSPPHTPLTGLRRLNHAVSDRASLTLTSGCPRPASYPHILVRYTTACMVVQDLTHDLETSGVGLPRSDCAHKLTGAKQPLHPGPQPCCAWCR